MCSHAALSVLVSVSCWVRGDLDEPKRGIFHFKIRRYDSNVTDTSGPGWYNSSHGYLCTLHFASHNETFQRFNLFKGANGAFDRGLIKYC